MPKSLFVTALLLASAALPLTAQAQPYPNKSVRLVVTFPPGGSSDVVARHHRAAAGGKAGPASSSSTTSPGAARRSAPPKSRARARWLHAHAVEHRADQPVAVHARAAAVRSGEELLRTSPTSARCRTCSSCIRRCRRRTSPSSSRGPSSRKDPIPYGSGGVGSIGHIVGELFKAGGGDQAQSHRLQGQLGPMHNDCWAARSCSRSTRCRRTCSSRNRASCACSRSPRPSARPWRPTCRRSSSSGLSEARRGEFLRHLGAGRRAAKTVADPLHKATMSALDDPKLRRASRTSASRRGKMTPEEFTAFVQKQVADWAPAVKASGAKLN